MTLTLSSLSASLPYGKGLKSKVMAMIGYRRGCSKTSKT